MAPRKRKVVQGEEEAAKPKTTSSTRVTRSSTRRANSNSASLPPAELPKQKKRKVKAEVEKKIEPAAVGTETETETKTDTQDVEEKEEAKESQTADDGGKKTIVIEHCKQCNSFKTRAMQVKSGLEKAISGITVVINPVQPRRGCLEIREKDGEKFVSLLDMKRPFKEMKALDMDKVISDIIDKIK